jgi:hypothetical protein
MSQESEKEYYEFSNWDGLKEYLDELLSCNNLVYDSKSCPKVFSSNKVDRTCRNQNEIFYFKINDYLGDEFLTKIKSVPTFFYVDWNILVFEDSNADFLYMNFIIKPRGYNGSANFLEKK